jgi:CheY-like chemotaxis protein
MADRLSCWWLTAHAPDLILLDVMLPDLDGFDLLRLLRSLPNRWT